MTTLSHYPSKLTRLFARIDASVASDETLGAALGYWKARRKSNVSPSIQEFSDLIEPFSSSTFLALPAETPLRGWMITHVGTAACAVLEIAVGQVNLCDLANRRLAARLRHLFQLALESGEPLSAWFPIGRPSGSVDLEALAAPLTTDGRRANAIFGGIAAVSPRRTG